MTFWFGFETTSERVTVGITCLLGLCQTFSEVKASLPPTSNINVMNKWMVTCIMFITAQMIEATIVDFLYDRLKNKLLLDREKEERDRELIAKGILVPQATSGHFDRRRNRLERRIDAENGRKAKKISKRELNWFQRTVGYYFNVRVRPGEPAYYPMKIDAYSRFLFPAAFALFCLYYWPALYS